MEELIRKKKKRRMVEEDIEETFVDNLKNEFIDTVAEGTARHIKVKTSNVGSENLPKVQAEILKKVREKLEIDKSI